MQKLRPNRAWGRIAPVPSRLLATVGCLSVALHAWGQSMTDQEEQRRRAQQQAQERAQQQSAPDVRLPAEAAPRLDDLSLPDESPCFPIHTLEVDGAQARPFAWIAPYLQHYADRCIGQGGINLIVKRIGAQLLAEGYVTTRIGIPAQDLSSGTLKLVVVPGVLRAIRIAEGSSDTHWQNAFPMKPGDLLNLRDLEQGLEQLKRVPSQDAEMDIVPGDKPGESDVLLKIKRSKAWRLGVSLDDSGLKATGKRQASLNYAWDNPLGLNDLFSLNLNSDAQQDDDWRGTTGYGWQYSLPWGYWTFGASESVYRYHQTVSGINQSFISSGASRSQEVKVQRLMYRDQSSKTTLQFRTGQRLSQSFVADTEIQVQHRRSAFAELALQQRQYVGPVQLDASLARREGVPWFGGYDDPAGHTAANPTYRYAMTVVDVGGLAAFHLGSQPVRWIGAFHGQTTHDVLYAADQIAIGNRYTVRGFDGEQTLSGERGWYLRNELEFALGASGQSLYGGVDHGRVGGPSTEALTGKHLTGGVLGLRGTWQGAYYDIFLSVPIQKPDGFTSAHPATGFQIGYQF